MAWPLTRLTTYVQLTGPAISADDLNAIQDAIGTTLQGGYSFKGIKVDGAGGASITPTPGLIEGNVLQADSTAGVAGSSTLATLGALYKDMVPIAIAQFTFSGALVRGINIASVVRNSTGYYTVTLGNGAAAIDHLVPLAVSLNSYVTILNVSTTSSTTIEIRTFDVSFSATDSAFCLIAYALG